MKDSNNPPFPDMTNGALQPLEIPAISNPIGKKGNKPNLIKFQACLCRAQEQTSTSLHHPVRTPTAKRVQSTSNKGACHPRPSPHWAWPATRPRATVPSSPALVRGSRPTRGLWEVTPSRHTHLYIGPTPPRPSRPMPTSITPG